MTKIFTALFFILSLSIFSQNRIKILDSENQKPISYAKLILKDKDYYKNTEENGEATLEKDEEVSEIQSFGYENLKVENSKTTYFLKPTFKEIEAIEISKPKFLNNYTIGNVKKTEIGYTSGVNTWGVINFFANQHKDEKLFIKKIRIPTEVYNTKREAIFNLVFYENIEGNPARERFKSLPVICKKGKHVTEIDFSKNPITFPKTGLFIGIEWIMNEQNYYQYELKVNRPVNPKEKYITKERVNPMFFGYRVAYSDRFENRLALEIELTN